MPQFFPTPMHFRLWLEKHHAAERELVVGFYVKDCGKPSITWPESVEEALCFGWIDGVRHSLNDDSYTIRFTPRKPTSIWSQKNLATMTRLMEQKRVAPAGMKIYESRDQKKTALYSFERAESKLPPEHEKLFRKNAKAWKFWEAQVPSYRKPATWWVVSAKQDATRERRLEILIECSAKGLKIPSLRRPNDKQG
ncbi:conserved hypothetical protein [Candidatus Koribacter versatilis Ellin345]|uniref:Bacteriocin-protection protein n=1 Tax=Koribacter versatilis (strain Ellin345) TaxID=204669 RepID=Q1IQ92_KORVE|nr:YdeI/OmpD-associated family protein [Candidatus Koribacter versatilis]ABF40958.1 conserved hypothetical protein [Candidatus Koribacter versatilis Ellin345]